MTAANVQPWSIDGLEKKATKNGYKKGTIEYENYIQTNLAKAYNSFKVPTISGYVILGCFVVLVLSIGLLRVISYLASKTKKIQSTSKKTKLKKIIQKKVTEKPIIGNRHAQEYGKGLFTIRAPLRLHVIILFSLYFANILTLTAFYQILDPAKNTSWPNDRYAAQSRYLADRASVLTVSQLPILFLLSGRNSPIICLTGCSFNTLMLYHRWIGRLIATLAFLHGTAYTAYHIHLGTYKQYWRNRKWFPFGPSALIIIIFIIVSAHKPIVRKYAYDAFIILHVILIIAAIILLHCHLYFMDSATSHFFIHYIYIAIAFWAFDRLARLVRLILFNFDYRLKTKQRWSIGRVESLKDINVLRITVELPQLCSALHNFVAFPGSHFYLYMPRIQTLTSHPFSLIQYRVKQDEDGQEKVQFIFYASVQKGITSVLNDKWQNKTLPIFVDGPYGVKHNISAFNDIFLFASGIGITYILSLLDGIIISNPTRNKNVHLVWCIRSIEMVTVAIDTFEEIKTRLKVGEVTQSVTISIFISNQGNISLFMPNDEKECFPLKELAVTSSVGEMTVNKSDHICNLDEKSVRFAKLQAIFISHPLFTFLINERRADVRQIITEQVDGQMAVFACGSDVFLDQIRNASLQVNASYFEEPFCW